MNTTNFDEFLEGLVLDDYNEIYELANAVRGESGNCYNVSESDGKLFIKCVYTKNTLALLTQKARDSFYEIIKQKYMAGMDQESYWGCMRAKEKSDKEDAKEEL